MSQIAHLVKPKLRDLGGGMTVRRILPAIAARSVGPFVFLDHIGPVQFQPGQGMDVRPHPHIGLATVTYLYEGEILHRDSLGYVQAIRPGDVNWMTAGKGIAHSERTAPELRATGFALHGLQSWVGLPEDFEEVDPSFHHHPAADLPEWIENGVRLKLIAGTAFGRESPVKVYAPTLYVAAVFAAGAALTLDAEHEERAIYVASGAIAAGGAPVGKAELAIFAPGAAVDLVAGPEGAETMLLGGAAMDGPRHMWWNFVSSRPERIERAKADWLGGSFGQVPGDDEFIPLPER
jgi:redox-sensitive bicupin YhaK (pirin superfamily)